VNPHSHRSLALFAAALAVTVVAGLAGCGSRTPAESPRALADAGDDSPVAAAIGEPPEAVDDETFPEAEGADAGAVRTAQDEEAEASFLSRSNRRDVTLFFQDPDSDLLVGETRQIFQTNSLTDQGKQIVVELIDGPRQEQLLPTIPRGTRVLGLYMDRWGTAYIDLSHELVSGHLGGTMEEMATIFSLVNSLTVNLPDIKRVHILVDGDERETLKSHLDLRRDYTQNLSIVRGHGG
jgi:hypothetical protein